MMGTRMEPNGFTIYQNNSGKKRKRPSKDFKKPKFLKDEINDFQKRERPKIRKEIIKPEPMNEDLKELSPIPRALKW